MAAIADRLTLAVRDANIGAERAQCSDDSRIALGERVGTPNVRRTLPQQTQSDRERGHGSRPFGVDVSRLERALRAAGDDERPRLPRDFDAECAELGRASCRERVFTAV